MNLQFVIKAWAACAPGLESAADWPGWPAWASAPRRPEDGPADTPAAVPHMPAMTRRRLSPLGRAAAHVAWACQRDDLGLPVVLGSRYGDAARSLDLLADLARGDALSPTGFGLSVHNAIGAQYSIARGDRANYVPVAAGSASAAAAVVEATALLHDGAPEALVVCYDAPLPGAYARFDDEPAATWAWAWRIALPRPGANDAIALAVEPADDGEDARPLLPFGLDALRFALSNERRLARRAEGRTWTWQRHG